jgi:hypothetical protein
MKRPEPLEMYQPSSLLEASRLLRDKGAGGRFLAGGTDLVIAIKEKGLVPKYLVDLKKVPGLSGIQENGDGSITIGALTTMREIETDPLLNNKYPFLCQSAAEVGSIQIRKPGNRRWKHGQRHTVGRCSAESDCAQRNGKNCQRRGRENRAARRVFSRSRSNCHEHR